MDVSQLLTELRALANRWALLARDYAREGRDHTNPDQAHYYRGFAEGYYKAATELAALLKSESVETVSHAPPPPASRSTAAPASAERSPAAAPAQSYLALSVGEIINILEFGGVSARDVSLKPGNTVYAVFSRWQPLSEHERVAKIAAADPRIVILSFGRLKDTTDPYVEFAFKQG